MGNIKYSTEDLKNDFSKHLPDFQACFTNLKGIQLFIHSAEILIQSQSLRNLNEVGRLSLIGLGVSEAEYNVLVDTHEKLVAEGFSVIISVLDTVDAGTGTPTDREIVLTRIQQYIKIQSEMGILT